MTAGSQRWGRIHASLARWSELRPTTDESRPWAPLIVLWVVVMTVAQVVRQPGTPSWDSIWQEDGGIFLPDALYESVPEALGHSYNAYLHFVPRLLASIAAVFPLDRAALVLSVGSALVVAVVSVYVYFASSSLLRSAWARVLLAGLVVVLPATSYETNANIANLHWYLLFACFWAFLVQPRSMAGVAASTAIVVASVLSDPMAGLFLPVALLAIVRRSERKDLVVPIAFFLSLAVQLVFGTLSDSIEPYNQTHAVDLPGIYALRVVGSLLVGDRHLDEFWGNLRWWFAWGGVVLVALAMVFALRKAHVSTRFYVAVCVAYSFGFLAVPLLLRGTEAYLVGDGFNLNGSRYTVVPIWFLVLAALLLLDRPSPVPRADAWRGVQHAFVLYSLILVLVNFSAFAVRSAGPSWREELAAARAQCARGERVDIAAADLGAALESRARRYGADVLVPIAPNIQPHPFLVPLSCSTLE